jgi:hypothetical protein
LIDDRIPLTDVMPTLLELTDDTPNGGYGKLYRAVLDGRLRTHRRGAQHEIDRVDLPLAARIVGLTLAADVVTEAA